MKDYLNIYEDSNFKDFRYRYPNEIFKPIPEYENLYYISNYGRVISLSQKKCVVCGHIDTKTRVISHWKRNKQLNYFHVILWKENKEKVFYVHRLVAITFLEKSDKKIVNHINGIQSCNHVSNLKWCTTSENNKHAYTIGLKTGMLGEQNFFSKIKESDLKRIHDMLLEKTPRSKIASAFKIKTEQLSRIIYNKSWKHTSIDFTQFRKKKSSQYNGVYCSNGRWAAAKRINGKRYFFGYFKTEIEAIKIYEQKFKNVS